MARKRSLSVCDAEVGGVERTRDDRTMEVMVDLVIIRIRSEMTCMLSLIVQE